LLQWAEGCVSDILQFVTEGLKAVSRISYNLLQWAEGCVSDILQFVTVG